MLLNKKEKDPDDFWREYEEKTGENILARGLGCYRQGWEEFDLKKWTSIWGIVMASSGGFRFHHFPQQNWFEALTQYRSREQPREKTIFIPKNMIISSRLIVESKWYKKIFTPSPPVLEIVYKDETGGTRQLLFETDSRFVDVAEKLEILVKSTPGDTL